MDYRLLFVEFTEACMRGYLDNIDRDQVQAVMTELDEIESILIEKGERTKVVDDAREIFGNCIDTDGDDD